MASMEDERDLSAECSGRGDRQDAVWHAGGFLQVIPHSSIVEEVFRSSALQATSGTLFQQS